LEGGRRSRAAEALNLALLSPEQKQHFQADWTSILRLALVDRNRFAST
jgi:hypothetical protein